LHDSRGAYTYKNIKKGKTPVILAKVWDHIVFSFFMESFVIGFAIDWNAISCYLKKKGTDKKLDPNNRYNNDTLIQHKLYC
jgi:hypothetical protein